MWPTYDNGGDDKELIWGIWLDRPPDWPHPVSVFSNKFVSPHDTEKSMVIFKRCSRGIYDVLLVSRIRCRTLDMALCDVILCIFIRDNPRSDTRGGIFAAQVVQISNGDTKGFTIYDHHCIQYPNYTKYKFELISYSACISQQGSYSHGKQGAESISLGFNIKMPSFQWRESYCGDKTKLRPFYLRKGISCTGNTPSVYRIRA